MSSLEGLKPIPTGTAYWVHAHASDPIAAAQLALIRLVYETRLLDILEVTVSTRLVNLDSSEPYEAIGFASILE